MILLLDNTFMDKHKPQTSPISFMATRKIASSNYKRPLRSPCPDENSNYNHNVALNYVSSITNCIFNDMNEELSSYSEIFNMEVSSYNTDRASASSWLSLLEGKPTAGSENPPIKEGQSQFKKELESILMRERGRGDELAMHVEDAFNEVHNDHNHNHNHNSNDNDKNKNRMKDVRRSVTRRLRSDHGYNAAICACMNQNANTTNRFLSLLNSFPSAEKHEYIDVILPNKVGGVGGVGERVFVELEFRAQFEIARPSASYKELVSMLPKVYVGNALHLLRLLRLMCDACKSSMELQGMCMPPWRSFDFIQARWFSPFTRTIAISTRLTHVSPHYQTKHCSNNKEWHPSPPDKLFDSSNSPSPPFSPSSTSCSDSGDDNRERMINVVGALKKAMMECRLA